MDMGWLEEEEWTLRERALKEQRRQNRWPLWKWALLILGWLMLLGLLDGLWLHHSGWIW